MDPQTLQALTAIFQQGLQLLQQASAGQPNAGGAMPPDQMADTGMEEDEGDPYGDENQPSPEGEEPAEDGMGGANLHDRVSELEAHTGLKKSARNLPLLQRIDGLEEELLGETYEGPTVERVQQLEDVTGLKKSARRQQRRQQDDAPDIIPLDTLIKSAIAEGVRQARVEESGQKERDLPSPHEMRKAAQQFGQRKGRAPAQQSETDLVKAAQSWGMDEDDLDEPISFGDILQMQYHAAKSGMALPFDDDDDD